ncbi:MAG TPA: cupin domain-containing protein [Flavipsychrobacter sp.]|nr:cupin domain-containing protein [Flavipsychrobacter sp.]
MLPIHSAHFWKEKLKLTKHIEGGSFKEVYRSQLQIAKSALTAQHQGDRSASTSIYFLLEHGEFSAFHRIASDELWHFYDGSCLSIYEINPDGLLTKHFLGRDIEGGEQLQVVISAGCWFASRVEEPDSYSLCGCTVAPGFDYADFELANRKNLQQQFPQHSSLIEKLTR